MTVRGTCCQRNLATDYTFTDEIEQSVTALFKCVARSSLAPSLENA